MSLTGSEIDRPAIDLPVAKARRVGAAAAAEFFRHFRFRGGLAPFLGFLQGALRCRGKRLLRGAFFRYRFAIVVVCVLHLFHHRMVY